MPAKISGLSSATGSEGRHSTHALLAKTAEETIAHLVRYLKIGDGKLAGAEAACPRLNGIDARRVIIQDMHVDDGAERDQSSG